MAGRPRKPTALRLIDGNPGKRAAPGKEPEPHLLLDLTAPEHLPQPVADVWNEVAPKLHRAKVLTELDTPLLEMTADAIASFRLAMKHTGDGKLLQRNAETGAVSISPWAMIKSMSFKQALAGLREFGATPAARTKVMVDPQADLFVDAKTAGPNRFFK